MADGKRCQVVRIIAPGEDYDPPYVIINVRAMINGKMKVCSCKSDSKFIEPIPLTPELLKELEFEERESGQTWAKEYAPDSWMFVTLYPDGERCKVNVYPSDFRREASMVMRCHLHELEAFLWLVDRKEVVEGW